MVSNKVHMFDHLSYCPLIREDEETSLLLTVQLGCNGCDVVSFGGVSGQEEGVH